MTRVMHAAWAFAMAGVLSAAGVERAHGQDYPQRPIRMIVPFAPGGGTDIVARLVAQRLSETMRQSVIVDNRAGGAGNIGAELAARATPDGHTLLVASATTLAVNPVLFKVGYDPRRDYAPITLLGSQPHLVVVHPSVPVQSVAEFVKLGKTGTARINYGSSGIGGPAHLGGELFKLVSGMQMMHVPYKGTGPAVVDLVGGQIQAGIMSLAPCLPHVKVGRLRALAVTSPKRSSVVPELPTVAESGYPGFEVRSWYGLLAPAGTPKPIVDRLAKEVATVLRQQEVVVKLAADGAEPGGDTPAEFAAYVRNEMDRWAKVVKAAGIRAE